MPVLVIILFSVSSVDIRDCPCDNIIHFSQVLKYFDYGNDGIQIVECHVLLVPLFRGNKNFFDAVGQMKFSVVLYLSQMTADISTCNFPASLS